MEVTVTGESPIASSDAPSESPSSSFVPGLPLARISPIGEIPLSPYPQLDDGFVSHPPAAPSPFIKALAFTLRSFLSGASNLSDEKQALFIGPSQAGIPSGSLIPPEVTNYQLYLKGDAVQRLNHPLYSAVNAGSYFELLYSFLRFVKDDNGKPGLAKARDDLFATEHTKYAQWQLARESYVLERTNVDAVPETFIEHLDQVVSYQAARATEDNAQTAYQNLLSLEMEDFSRQLSIVKSANDPSVLKRNNNMPCDATSLDYIDAAYHAGKPVASDPRNIYYRPLYNIADYAHVVNNWSTESIRKAQQGQGPTTIPLDPASLSESSWAELGHPGLDDSPVTAFTESQAQILSNTTASITFHGAPGIFDLERGLWDMSPLPDSPLADDAPEYLKHKFVKTTRLLLAWGLEINLILPEGISAQSVASLRLFKWGIPFSSIGTDGRHYRFTAGDGYYPIIVAALGNLVGGSAADEASSQAT